MLDLVYILDLLVLSIFQLSVKTKTKVNQSEERKLPLRANEISK